MGYSGREHIRGKHLTPNNQKKEMEKIYKKRNLSFISFHAYCFITAIIIAVPDYFVVLDSVLVLLLY